MIIRKCDIRWFKRHLPGAVDVAVVGAVAVDVAVAVNVAVAVAVASVLFFVLLMA